MKKALVTGGAGFIGSHLVDALVAQGVPVVVLDDLSTGKKENLDLGRIDFIEGDITDSETLRLAAEGCDVIFHLAAIASVQKSVEEPLSTHRVNTEGTLAVFEAAREKSVPAVVYASSSAVYGKLPDMPKREDSPCCPSTPYGLHKMLGEAYGKLYHELHGLRTVGLRFFNVYGERQDASSPYSGVISIFREKLSRGEPITVFGDGETTRDFVYVSDVVAALIAAAEKGSAGDVYNIGTGAETSLKEVIRALEAALGVSADVSFGPERAGDIKRSVADVSKAGRELGWRAGRSFAEGIARLAA